MVFLRAQLTEQKGKKRKEMHTLHICIKLIQGIHRFAKNCP